MNIEIEKTSREKFQENGWGKCGNNGVIEYFCKTIAGFEIMFSLHGNEAFTWIASDDRNFTPSDLMNIASELKKLEEN